MIRASSIFFLEGVRISSSNMNATRVSMVLDSTDRESRGELASKRWEVLVDPGKEVHINDLKDCTTVRIPWHVVRDWIEAPAEKKKT